MSSHAKAARLADVAYLADTKRFQECLDSLRNAFLDFVLSNEDILSIVQKIVDKIRQDVQDKLSSVAPDPVLCWSCCSYMDGAVTFPCGHTYCGNCSVREACPRCSEVFPSSEHKKNIVIAIVVKNFWSKECEGIALRNEGNEKIKRKQYEEAVALYNAALLKHPRDHIALANNSHALLCLGRTTDALVAAVAAVEACPLWSRAYSHCGSAQMALGRTVDACVSMLLCTALCDADVCPRYTADLAKVVERLLVEESRRTHAQLLRQLPLQVPCFDSNFEAPLRDCRSSPPALVVDDVSPEGVDDHAIPDRPPDEGTMGEPSHFKKIWKEKSLRRVETSASTSAGSERVPALHFCADVLARLNASLDHIRDTWDKSQIELPQQHALKSEDLECSLCMRLLWRPVSTPCGHSFCLACLNRSLDHRPSCPLCKSSLVKFLADRRYLECDFVTSVTRRVFPVEFSVRERQMQTELDTLSEAGRDPNHPIPIFVATVALPFVQCPLHVFEPRYKLMIRRCMESGTREFGMCGPVDNFGYYEYGTTLEIRDIRYLPDGRSILNTVGKRRFQVLTRSERDGYNVASVRYVVDEPPARLEETQRLHDQVRRNVEVWLQRMPDGARQQIVECCGEMPAVEHLYWTKPHGPDWLWWLASVLPIHHLTKQSLLAMLQLQHRIQVLHHNLLRFFKDTWTMDVPRKA